jgi:TatD DNase family protein
MAHTVRAIAELWQVSEEDACQRLSANATRVYGDW